MPASPGVGKGSLSVMKEWLETGKCEALEASGRAPAGAGAAAAKAALTAEAAQAMAFL